MSSTSRRSLVSITSTARPLTTSPPHVSPPTARSRLPSSPAIPMVSEAKRLAYQKRKYYTVHHAQPATRAHAPNITSSASVDYGSPAVASSLPTSPYPAANYEATTRQSAAINTYDPYRVGSDGVLHLVSSLCLVLVPTCTCLCTVVAWLHLWLLFWSSCPPCRLYSAVVFR